MDEQQQQLQQAFIQYLAQKLGVQSQEELDQALQNMSPEELQQAYAEFMQLIQQQQGEGATQEPYSDQAPVSYAKNGAKIRYIDYLRGKCPEGYEVGYFQKGGHLCKQCIKKQQEIIDESYAEPQNAIEAFKCGRQIRKRKCEQGSSIEMSKCGSKTKKPKAADGTKINSRKGLNGTPYTRKKQDNYNWTDTKKDSQGRTSVRTVTEDGTWYTGRNGRSGMEGTAVGDSIRNADWRTGERVQKVKPAKKEFGGPFVPFTHRGLR